MILLYEKDDELRDVFSSLLSEKDTCLTASTLEEALALSIHNPDTVIIDVNYSKENIVSFIDHIRSIVPASTIILTVSTKQLFSLAQEYKPDHILFKPFDIETIDKIICNKNVDGLI